MVNLLVKNLTGPDSGTLGHHKVKKTLHQKSRRSLKIGCLANDERKCRERMFGNSEKTEVEAAKIPVYNVVWFFCFFKKSSAEFT